MTKRPATPPSSGGGELILIADDSEDNRDLYRQYLVFSGYRVAEAVDGEDALDKAGALRPAVILMDLSMPRLDGWEVIRRLKADPVTRTIPVVALTGHALDESRKRAESVGCDAYLTKPLLPQDLATAIRGLLGAKA